MKISKALIILLVLLGTLFALPEYGKAESGVVYEVGDIVLNVRSEPSSGGTVIGKLQRGDQVIAFKEEHGWIQTYYAGKEAWVAAHYLIMKDRPNKISKAENQELKVTGQSVYVRSGPGTNYSVIGSTTVGDTYNIVAKDNGWYKIKLHDGSAGWIASWLTNKPSNTNNSKDQNNKVTATVPDKVKGISTSNPLKGYTIVLDAGHGGKDPGAIGLEGIKEKTLNSQTAEQVANVLRAKGATVVETRTSDRFLSLDQRAEISNAYNTDAFISIHYNAFPIQTVSGIGAYYSSKSKDFALAEDVQDSLSNTLPLFNRGLYQEEFRVLRKNNAPAVLLELGYLTNPSDLSIIQTTGYQEQAAHAIADGLVNYFD
ncbi:N-acetylmuramoyl-L-alanine amidase [Oceanobacillus manasiensis]|uniref:N-acetylmuramoyl-L-alanine amidase n=1 Tax=Oceanobacillus manasiensis TaxID=586413 RepID=UPI0005AA399B|nr:N-acetylmuramoyl-L-alanine amidase [Oceanobacillus manasiensis]